MFYLDFGTSFIQHCIICAGFSQNLKLSNFDKDNLEKIYDELMKAEKFTIEAGETGKQAGWIIMRNSKQEAEERKKQIEEQNAANTSDNTNTDNNSTSSSSSTTNSIQGPIFDSFVPFLYKQYENQENQSFEVFDEAVDEYFSKIETQKIDIQKTAKASAVEGKLGKVKKDQTKRIHELESKSIEYDRKALLIQDNVEDVDKAILIIRSAVANSMDWSELDQIVKEEKKNGDRIAEIIHKLKLKENTISLLLSNIPYDSSEEELTSKPEIVDIDISLSAFANVKRYYDMKKNAKEKKSKTESAVHQALKAAQKKAERDIKQVKIKSGIQKMRKQFWFEKFYWFLSSDNYIIVSGRDAQQNELLVKRYMQKGDLYVHADIHGASSCIIKNPSGNTVTPTTLEQAGQLAICRSAAWSAKVVTSAYWVYHHQVSKTAPSGEYLTTGSFMIRGKKNFLPPAQLLMGFALLFRVDESCVSRHLGERGGNSSSAASALSKNSDDLLIDDNDDNDANFQKLGSDQTPQKSLPSSTTTATTNDDSNEKHDDSSEINKQTNDNDGDNAAVDSTQEENPSDDKEEEEEDEDDTPDDENKPAASVDDNETEEQKTPGTKEKFQPAHLGIPEKYRVDYSMVESDEEDDDDDDNDDNDDKTTGRRRLTKRERRLMKKGIDPTTVTPSNSNDNENKNADSAKKKSKGDAPQQLTRRQRKKMKIIKSKYKDQDEEERAMRLRILGSAGPNQPASDSKQDQTDENDDNDADDQSMDAKYARSGNENDKRSEEEKKKMKEEREESLQQLTSEQMSNLSLLDELTGKPQDDDVLIAAIPMCAPYASIKDYKFKVKLTPGSSKTGRAVQTTLNVFKQSSTITAQEKEMINAMNDSEAMLQMMGNVNISTPGLSNLNKNKNKNKNKKKGKKK